jgi:flagellar motor switch protein FliG
MPFNGGVKGAAKLLASLNPVNRKRLFEELSRKDPGIVDILKKNMVSMEDLTLLTVKMIQDLTRDIEMRDLGLALRMEDDELRDHFLLNISKSMKEDVQEILKGPPQPLQKVQEAQEKILSLIRVKIDRGEIVLSKDSKDKLV